METKLYKISDEYYHKVATAKKELCDAIEEAKLPLPVIADILKQVTAYEIPSEYKTTLYRTGEEVVK